MSFVEIAIIAFVAATLVVGIRTYTQIKGQATNYYVAGNTMPVWVIGITLCAQAFDANGSMGNASLSHGGGFWAGAMIPIGLAVSLFFIGALFARPMHRMHLMTLADFYRRRYSGTTETLATLVMLVSNVILVAGNLAGLGLLLQMVFGAGYLPMLIVIAICILTYAVTGGLFATIRTSVLQVAIFIIGTLIAFAWMVGAYGWGPLMATVPEGFTGLGGLLDPGKGALVNWAAFLSLAVGDVVAIDFIQRVVAAESPSAARRGCYAAGAMTLAVGIPVTFMGLFAHAFDKEPSRFLLVDLAFNDMPFVVGDMLLLGIIAASMSTAAGVVLALSNVLTRNLVQRYTAGSWDNRTMLRFSRWITLPTMAASVAFAYIRPEPGVLLVLAFDVVLAGCFVPLALGLYWKRSNAPGAIASIVVGSTARVILHFAVPEVYAGLDTMLPPLLSLVVFVVVSIATQGRYRPRHEALEYRPSDEELVSGTY